MHAQGSSSAGPEWAPKFTSPWMMRTSAGIDAILGFAWACASARIHGEAKELWFAAIVEPADQGARENGERKIRPIGLSEALTKLCESVIIDKAIHDIKKRLEPCQRGVTTPDGVVQVVRLIRGFADDIQSAAYEHDAIDEDCITGTDLKNASCKFLRAPTLDAARRCSATLAVCFAGQWSGPGLLTWQRTESGWGKDRAVRGGWQVSRATQVAFALGAEEAFHKGCPPDAQITRVGIVDDFCLVGSAVSVANNWANLVKALAEHGHVLRHTKCAVWSPARDDGRAPTAGLRTLTDIE